MSGFARTVDLLKLSKAYIMAELAKQTGVAPPTERKGRKWG
jgi:hypothetical protein